MGEVWLDDERFAITPNTLVYTPMGVVHLTLLLSLPTDVTQK
jgi:mannose-6-phosphate isomerase-like protein (cupin superfamily)